MIKNTLSFILLLFLIYLSIVFIKSGHTGESFSIHIREEVVQLTSAPRERIINFLEKRRENIEKEVEREREQIKEEAKDTGGRIWQEIIDFVLRRKSEE